MEVGKRGIGRWQEMVGRRGREGGEESRAREGRPQKLPILLGFARTRQGGQVGPVGKCVRRTILVGLHGFAQARPNFYFSIPAGAGAKHGGQT